ncbi:MAG: DNA/RNA non-specific endonuclease [Lachnospiraceae bacterium]|nr:DNA/RNA non-specific endonuclease [Lachnospiraceae bacterium]
MGLLIVFILAAAGLFYKPSIAVDVLANIPEYSGEPITQVNDNYPAFTVKEKSKTTVFEKYSSLDRLGRCGPAFAMICQETMPVEEMSRIGNIRPSGWQTVKYNDRIDGNYLYNRCHLIGFQLAGEGANEKNLITGTRYLNVLGMLPYENQIAQYINETSNHVLYRVTPFFEGNNLVAAGVQMEAWSIEDEGKGICFNIYCYNVQPGIVIDYATGDSFKDPEYQAEGLENNNDGVNRDIFDPADDLQRIEERQDRYILNKNTHKIHIPTCTSVDEMKEKNKEYYTGSIKEIIEAGYSPCHNCLGSAAESSEAVY